jgi:glycosyltransferase involved in cell wall biosynthesis
MKIVHIITRLIVGGAQENTLITCAGLAERGHDVTLITGPALGPEGQLFHQTLGQKYRTLVVREMRRSIRPLLDFASYHRLKGYLEGLKPDIVHTHSAKAGILGRRAAAHLKPRPHIVHGVHGLSFHPYQRAALNRLYVGIERYADRWTDAYIPVADAMRAQSQAVGIGTKKPYVTAYSAIAAPDFYRETSAQERLDFRAQYNIPPDAVVLVTVARLFQLKGHDFIIESARTLAQRFPKAIWLFVGNGNLAQHYENQIREYGLTQRFRFTGLVTPEEVPLTIQASDILVHCSLREGLARTLPQAMLCRRPAISYDVDGAGEVVNTETGRLIEPRNVPQLIDACAELIADENLRKQLGQNGWEQVHRKFAPATMVDTIEQVYERLLAGTL